MTTRPNGNPSTTWIDGELRLAGMLDSRIISLLRAIEESGSINRAAKGLGLSYKGAWQMIERANNGAPKILVATATGGVKGGGTSLTEAGHALLELFTRLERQHQQFIEQLNRSLAGNADAVLLLQRLVVKTSARNQLFGRIFEIREGAVNAEIAVKLKAGEPVVVGIGLASLHELGIETGADAVLLINSADIMLSVDSDPGRLSARNRLPCTVLRIRQDGVEAEVTVLLPGGEVLSARITGQSVQNLSLEPGRPVWAVFKTNAPILGVMPP
ncbi:MAG: TOBE domain-containing protein, partial [Gammaproteobacteria bacterium]